MKSPNSMILVISEFLNACQYIFETSIVIILDSGMRMIWYDMILYENEKVSVVRYRKRQSKCDDQVIDELVKTSL